MKERLILKKSVKKFLYTIILLLITLISIKENVYENSISVIPIRNIYDKYFAFNNTTEPVVKEIINRKKEEKTDNGVKLKVDNNSPIINLESGIIVLIDSNKMIIEQVDGVTAIYENIINHNYKMYDYIEKGEIIGEASSNEVFISFKKEGKYYDYQKYL